MNYVIDRTPRGPIWIGCFEPGQAQLVISLQAPLPVINREDVVFAHTDTDFDLGPTGAGLDSISQFRRHLPINRANAPLIIMYTGNGLSDEEGQEWIDLCVNEALPGFPADRVKFIRDPIPRQVDPAVLTSITNECLPQWRLEQQNVEASLGDEAGTTTSNASASAGYSVRDPSAFLALRLLCDAWEQVTVMKEPTVHGITIHAPMDFSKWLAPFGGSSTGDIERVVGMIGSGDIRTKAKAVLESANGTGDLTEAIGEFLKPKQVNSAPQ